ncbi:MAG: hypothetical protein ACREGA_01640 [Candidatus Saccharimonadales bacterium]
MSNSSNAQLDNKIRGFLHRKQNQHADMERSFGHLYDDLTKQPRPASLGFGKNHKSYNISRFLDY